AFLEFENEAQEKESVFVKFEDLNSARNNDEVIASIYKGHNEKNPTRQLLAVVDEIVQRNNQKIIGFIKKDKNTIFFAPPDGCFDKVKFELLNLSFKVKINDCV
ncbi:ribonuclease R, partial [Mycoplasmopsis synoviae]